MSVLQSLPLLIGGVTEPPLYIGLAATFLGALSGAIFSSERKFPITGVLAIAISVGLGGGIIRDVIAGMTTEPAFGYIAVYGLEITLLAATLIAMRPLVGPAARPRDGRVQTEPHPQAGV